MMRWIISSSMQLRLLVVASVAVLMVVGVMQLRQTPVDAVPDFTRPYVELQTEALGLSAEEVEAMITTPLEADMLNGTAWVDEAEAELVKVEMTAIDSISIGWGIVGRVAEGSAITYHRRPVAPGLWFPASARFDARGRTLLFRSFDIDTTTEWYDYQPFETDTTSRASEAIK